MGGKKDGIAVRNESYRKLDMRTARAILLLSALSALAFTLLSFLV